MKDFVFLTACNQPRLRDPTKALEVIDRYSLDWDLAIGIESGDSDHHLTIEGEGWPGAWKFPPEVPADRFEPDLARDGILDFESLLEDLSPCLADPLIVQAIGSVGGQFPLLAAEWRVEPRSREVQHRQFSTLGSEAPGPVAAAPVLQTC